MDKILNNRLTENNSKNPPQKENKLLDNFSNIFTEYQLMREL